MRICHLDAPNPERCYNCALDVWGRDGYEAVWDELLDQPPWVKGFGGYRQKSAPPEPHHEADRPGEDRRQE